MTISVGNRTSDCLCVSQTSQHLASSGLLVDGKLNTLVVKLTLV